MAWLITLERLARPLTQRLLRLTRGLTLGVRAVVTDKQGRVLLVEHSYVAGWHLPGGGVERGETCGEALERELMEEAGVRLTGRPVLLSIHSQEAQFPGDHVLVYRTADWEPCAAANTGEIVRIGWFAADALPDGTTRGTRRRIGEALEGNPAEAVW